MKKNFGLLKIPFEVYFEKKDPKNIYKKITADESRKKFNSITSRRKVRWWLVIIGLSLCLLLFPVIANFIILYDGENVDFLKSNSMVAKDNDWISFLGSYAGSILGGIIGGAMTLIGVRLTISNKNKEDMINTYPLKRKAIKEFKRKIEILDSKLEPFIFMKQSKSSHEYICEINQVVRDFENDEKLSELAGEVNGFLLMLILDFIELNEDMDKELVMSGDINTLSERILKDIILDLKLNWQYINNTIDAECEAMLLEMEDIILKK